MRYTECYKPHLFNFKDTFFVELHLIISLSLLINITTKMNETIFECRSCLQISKLLLCKSAKTKSQATLLMKRFKGASARKSNN